MNRSRIPLCGLGLIVTAASLMGAAPAAAATLTVDYGAAAATYKAAAGETNKLTVSSLGTSLTLIQDPGVKDVPLGELGGAACVVMEPWKYKCPTAAVTAVNVDLADGSDVFDGAGSGFAESVEAGAGAKTISTGAGNDRVFARNGAADEISCGAGTDEVVGDPQDAVAADCEYVDLGDSAAGVPDATDALASGSGGTANGIAPTASRGAAGGLQTALGLILPPRALVLPRPDTAIVPLACAATSTTGCRGDVVLELPAGSAPKAKGSGKVIAARGHYVAQQRARRLGSRRYRLAAGQKTALPVRIRFRGHFTAVERRRRKRAALKIAERDAAGKVVDVQTRVVTLKLSTNAPRRHR